MTQQKRVTFNTPKGVAMYPWLNRPDTQFDAGGQFKVNLRMPANDAKPLMDEIRDAAKTAFGDKSTKARMPYKTDADTGDIIFTMKSKFSPKAFDTTGALISPNNLPQIYGGSVLKASGNIYPYTAGGSTGVSLQLAGVQIVELSEGNNSSISFAAEEGSFVAANDAENGSAAGAGEYDF